MKKSTRNILEGVGSILSIMPPSQVIDYFRFVPNETDEERLADIWLQVGDDIRKATEQYSNEHDAKSIHP